MKRTKDIDDPIGRAIFLWYLGVGIAALIAFVLGARAGVVPVVVIAGPIAAIALGTLVYDWLGVLFGKAVDRWAVWYNRRHSGAGDTPSSSQERDT